MKVIITMDSKEASEKVSNVFGRCAFFAVYNQEEKKLDFIDNPGASQAGGAGIAAAQAVVDQGVKKVVTGHIGPNASAVLEENGVEVSFVTDKTLQEVIDELLS